LIIVNDIKNEFKIMNIYKHNTNTIIK